MGLNIKSEEAHRLAHELAALTGETMTAAVTQAMRERLERVKAERRPLAGRAARMMEISGDCADRIGDRLRGRDHDALLYDDRGLPK